MWHTVKVFVNGLACHDMVVECDSAADALCNMIECFDPFQSR